MTIDGAVMMFAGTLTLLGLLFAFLFSPWCLVLPVFVSLNLVQAPLTGFCPAALFFRKLGFRPGSPF